MNLYLYSSDYYPAAPVLEVMLGKPGGAPILGTFAALVDTGADYTLVPSSYLEQVEAEKVDYAILRSHWGEPRTVSTYAVAVQIGPYYFAAPQVVGDELGDEIVLGRNILNRLRLLLDGPAAAVTVLNDAV